MTLKDLGRMIAHWRKHPPAHIAIADMRRDLLAAQGVEMRDGTDLESSTDESSLRSFVAAINGV